MAEIPVLIGNEYYKNSTETHYEGYVETRAEMANASTDWAVGRLGQLSPVPRIGQSGCLALPAE